MRFSFSFGSGNNRHSFGSDGYSYGNGNSHISVGAIKNKKVVIAILSIALAVLVALCAFLFIPNITKQFKLKDVYENGIETTAMVIGTERGPRQENDSGYAYEYLYALECIFKDQNGLAHSYTTQATYSQSSANNLVGKTIPIKYDPETFLCVDPSFMFAFNLISELIPLIIVVIMIIVITTFLIVTIVRKKSEDKVEANGETYLAEFISHQSSYTGSGQNLFRIQYSWEENGVRKEGFSDYVYTFAEAQAFERVRNFRISVLGNKSVITENPVELNQTASTPEVSTQTFNSNSTMNFERRESSTTCKCKHCGSTIAKEARFCHNCGAPQE